MDEESSEISNSFDYEQEVDPNSVPQLSSIENSAIIKQISIGLCMCLVAFSVVAFRGTADTNLKTNQAVIAATGTIKTSEVAAAPIINTTTTSTVESSTTTTVEPTTTEKPVPKTVFSANRASCHKFYSNPTGVALRLADPVVEPEAAEGKAAAKADAAEGDAAEGDAAEVDPAPEEETTTSTTEPEEETTTSSSTTTTKPVAPAAPPGWADAGHGVNVPIVMLVIRCCESLNNYTVQNGVSTASGAYQFLNGTWANQFGVSRAMYATPAQQDQAAVKEWQRNGTRPWNASKNCWGTGA